jgi:hypothetical protein
LLNWQTNLPNQITKSLNLLLNRPEWIYHFLASIFCTI